MGRETSKMFDKQTKRGLPKSLYVCSYRRHICPKYEALLDTLPIDLLAINKGLFSAHMLLYICNYTEEWA